MPKEIKIKASLSNPLKGVCDAIQDSNGNGLCESRGGKIDRNDTGTFGQVLSVGGELQGDGKIVEGRGGGSVAFGGEGKVVCVEGDGIPKPCSVADDVAKGAVKGGGYSNSHPSNVHTKTTFNPPHNVQKAWETAEKEKGMYVCGGIDTLCLAIYTEQNQNSEWFLLFEAKARAIETKTDCPVKFGGWDFAIRPNGANGYAFCIQCCDMRWQVGDWETPKTRPTIMVDLRSEFLWRVGVEGAINTVTAIIEAAGAKVVRCVPSRVDFCVDLLLPEGAFRASLIENRVTRADRFSIHGGGKQAQTLTFGSGQLLCRIYDKGAEIEQASGKTWFFDIWGLEAVPEDAKVIRVEFQIRREKLSELGMNSIEELFGLMPGAWAYLTHKWLKMVRDPEKHVSRQHLLAWWKTVQDSFPKAQGAFPLVLGKAVGISRKRELDQIVGHWTTLASIESNRADFEGKDFCEVMTPVLTHANKKGLTDSIGFKAAVREKRNKHVRQQLKYHRALKSREIALARNEVPGEAVAGVVAG